jgi:glycosyltransferase involved in cell wall biosynthesis
MRIACYALAYNEEIILPQFIEHYKKFCDKIVIYDNMSTDNTKEIALDNGCEVISWEAPGGGLNDQCYLEIKQNCYKKDREDFDWVIVVDVDEFITHKDGDSSFIKCMENYTNTGIMLPKVKGYNMFSWDHDLSQPLTQIREAVPSVDYSKSAIFNPLLNLSWDPGCHICHLPNDSDDEQLVLKHYKFINYDYVVERSLLLEKRLSEENRKKGYGTHYTWNDKKWYDYFKSLEKEKINYGTYPTI